MQNFYIITNSQKDPGSVVTHQIVHYLEENNCRCQVRNNDDRIESGPYHYTDANEIEEDVDCILVIGGDGTLLQAARDLVNLQIPLFGINMGTLGFLAEVDRAYLFPALDQLMMGDYQIEPRMMLQGDVYRGEEKIGSDKALNDIIICRSGALRIIGLKNYVNGEYLNSYDADGMIVCTPTGSTGYSLSAGGPIISPDARMIMITPLAAHTLNSRSLILSPDDVIQVEIGTGRKQTEVDGQANFDGDTSIPMRTGDRILIRQSETSVQLVKLDRMSFVEVLRRKLD